jgi:hypothetical protein
MQNSFAFRVGEYHPRRVTLPDIGPPSTEGKETFDFCGLIDRTEVRMESVLACLLLRNRHEQQARHPIRSRPDLELVRGVAHDNPAQGLGPPSTKRDRIVSVDDDLLPNEIHVAHSARSVSQADRLTGIGYAAAARVGERSLARATVSYCLVAGSSTLDSRREGHWVGAGRPLSVRSSRPLSSAGRCRTARRRPDLCVDDSPRRPLNPHHVHVRESGLPHFLPQLSGGVHVCVAEPEGGVVPAGG